MLDLTHVAGCGTLLGPPASQCRGQGPDLFWGLFWAQDLAFCTLPLFEQRLENCDRFVPAFVGHCFPLIMAENGSQTHNPSRGFFTWHEDMRRLDGRVGTLTDRVSVLEGDVLKSGDMRTLRHMIQMIEVRVQGMAEIMDSHSAHVAKRESLSVPEVLASAAVNAMLLSTSRSPRFAPPLSRPIPFLIAPCQRFW